MLLCLIILTCCYAKIFNRLRRQEMQVHSHFQQGQQKTGLKATLNKTQYKKTVSSALCVQIAFFFLLPSTFNYTSIAKCPSDYGKM